MNGRANVSRNFKAKLTDGKKQYIQTNAEMNRLFNALITTRERLNRVLKVLSNIDWGDEGNAEATVKEITMQLATEYDTEEQE